MRILIIDDDEAVRKTMSRMLVASGHEVVEAADGRAGLRLFQAQSADVVVTDIMMPDQDGIETVRELRKLAPLLRIVVISGGGHGFKVDFLEMTRMLGADATLPKPFRKDELLACVEGRSAGRSSP